MNQFLKEPREIMAWLEANNYYYQSDDDNVSIDEAGMVSTSGNVLIDTTNLEFLPVKFKEVGGCFIIEPKQLTGQKSKGILKSLAGCPISVKHDFICSGNKLTNLIGGPEVVGENYFCKYNCLTSLEGAPEEVMGLWAEHNELTNLKHIPKKIYTIANLTHNKLENLNDLLSVYIGGSIFLYGNSQLSNDESFLLDSWEIEEYVKAYIEKTEIEQGIKKECRAELSERKNNKNKI